MTSPLRIFARRNEETKVMRAAIRKAGAKLFLPPKYAPDLRVGLCYTVKEIEG